MNNHRHYTTEQQKTARKILVFALACIVLAGIVYTVALNVITAGAEETLCRCWVMCKPGDYVNVRRTPDRHGQEVGRLECGDWFKTDGTSSNGFIRVYGIGEYGEGWIHAGYVSTEAPVKIGERYTVTAKNRVFCRRWMNGPKTDGRGYLVNGSNVQVFCMADGWACTNRGYIRSEWLEADPE